MNMNGLIFAAIQKDDVKTVKKLLPKKEFTCLFMRECVQYCSFKCLEYLQSIGYIFGSECFLLCEEIMESQNRTYGREDELRFLEMLHCIIQWDGLQVYFDHEKFVRKILHHFSAAKIVLWFSSDEIWRELIILQEKIEKFLISKKGYQEYDDYCRDKKCLHLPHDKTYHRKYFRFFYYFI